MPMKEVLEKLLKVYKIEGNIAAIKIKEFWAALMGNIIVRHTKEIIVIDKKLLIRLDSPALRNELSYSKEKIKDAVNNEFGYDAVTEVIIR